MGSPILLSDKITESEEESRKGRGEKPFLSRFSPYIHSSKKERKSNYFPPFETRVCEFLSFLFIFENMFFFAFKTNRERRSDGFSKTIPATTRFAACMGRRSMGCALSNFRDRCVVKRPLPKSFIQPRLFARGKCNSLRGRYATYCRRSKSISWFSSFFLFGKTGEEDRFRKLEAEASKDNEHSWSEKTMDRVGEME